VISRDKTERTAQQGTASFKLSSLPPLTTSIMQTWYLDKPEDILMTRKMITVITVLCVYKISAM
jgi:hypothetical protein